MLLGETVPDILIAYSLKLSFNDIFKDIEKVGMQ